MAARKDAQTELLQLYRDNYELRQERALSEEKARQMSEELERLRKENEELREQNEDLESRLTLSTPQIANLKAEIVELRKTAVKDASQITKHEATIKSLKKSNADHVSKNKSLHLEIKTLQKSLRDSEAKVKELEGQNQPVGSRPFPLKRWRISTGDCDVEEEEESPRKNLKRRKSAANASSSFSSSPGRLDWELFSMPPVFAKRRIRREAGTEAGADELPFPLPSSSSSPSTSRRRESLFIPDSSDMELSDDQSSLPDIIISGSPTRGRRLDAAKQQQKRKERKEFFGS